MGALTGAPILHFELRPGPRGPRAARGPRPATATRCACSSHPATTSRSQPPGSPTSGAFLAPGDLVVANASATLPGGAVTAASPTATRSCVPPVGASCPNSTSWLVEVRQPAARQATAPRRPRTRRSTSTCSLADGSASFAPFAPTHAGRLLDSAPRRARRAAVRSTPPGTAGRSATATSDVTWPIGLLPVRSSRRRRAAPRCPAARHSPDGSWADLTGRGVRGSAPSRLSLHTGGVVPRRAARRPTRSATTSRPAPARRTVNATRADGGQRRGARHHRRPRPGDGHRPRRPGGAFAGCGWTEPRGGAPTAPVPFGAGPAHRLARA